MMSLIKKIQNPTHKFLRPVFENSPPKMMAMMDRTVMSTIQCLWMYMSGLAFKFISTQCKFFIVISLLFYLVSQLS